MKELNTIREVAEAILDGKEVEFKNTDKGEWLPMKILTIPVDRIDNKTDYRYRDKPSKPSINWEHLSKELNYLATDEDGKAFLFKDRPSTDGEDDWLDEKNLVFINAKGFSSFKVGNCHWTESLVERPRD